ncbi:hypothetical protein K1T71_014854 [Dendrolimus kikuchii]|nr:hypothetical protein K1T71_014854 [Dendrolimus kikuchii]
MFAVFFWKGGDKRRIQRSNCWITRVFGVSNPAGSDNTLTLWTSGDIAKEVETLPEEEVKTKAMSVLRRFLGKTMTIPEPTGMISFLNDIFNCQFFFSKTSMWHSNPFTRGSYTYDNILTPQYPNARLDLGSPLLDSAGKPSHHFSTVHGAVETGYREAMRLLPGGSKI